MSKSYGNTILIFDEGKALKDKVMKIVTDPTPLEEPKNPDTCNVFALIKLVANSEKMEEIRQAYLKGGYGYGHAKKELLGLLNEYFGEARERRKELEKNTDIVFDLLREGGKKARIRAEQIMEPIREATGLINTYQSVERFGV
jgi:tryptophanyl-tRNA synthetase